MLKLLSSPYFCLFAIALTLGLPNPGHAVQLLPHRVVYDLKLQYINNHSGTLHLAGRMVYELRGSECDGYTVNFRFLSEMLAGETLRMLDQHVKTYENVRDDTFHFFIRSFIDQNLSRETQGKVQYNRAKNNTDNDTDKMMVVLEKPARETLYLPQSLFPTKHLIELIKKAKKGVNIYEARVFDGTDGGKKSFITTSIIGDMKPVLRRHDQEISIIGKSGKAAIWPVTVSYFEEIESGDALPIYRVSFKLYENGIMRDMTMTYDNMIIKGRISGFEISPQKAVCE